LARPRPTLAALACLGVLTFAVAPAQAAFPGANGKIAFHSNRDGNFEIYAMNPDGTSQARLTNNAASDLSPAWSPDGTKIAFTSNRDGNFELYSMNANGTGQTRLTNNAASDVQPAWSPDGTKIAFTSDRAGNLEIYSMNANGTSPARLTNNAASDRQPAWAPDDTKIAFTSNRDGNDEIYSMNTNGTTPTRLTNNTIADDDPTWSPSGTRIAFATAFGTLGDIVTINPNGTGPQTISDPPGRALDEPAWSPAGDSIAVTVDAEPFQIHRFSPDGSFQANVSNNSFGDQGPDWQAVVRNYARPIGATPLRVPLVPAYKQCTTANNSKHKGALAAPSCVPPAPVSSYLTVGSPDFNGVPAKASGFVRMTVICQGGATGEAPPCLTSAGDQLDGSVVVSQTDVRCQGATAGCGGGALADYAGTMLFELSARVTDRNNLGATGAGTLQDVVLRFPVPCATTADATVGSTCSTTTSIDAVIGGATGITEQKRAIWGVTDKKLYDGGADGVGTTLGGNTLFAIEGLFFP
jgi:Tol biopolymer transport system component